MVAKGRFGKSRFVLKAVSNDGIDEDDLTFFVGKTGVAKTVLRPAGIGEFNGVKLSVVSDGEFIPKDERIEVFRVEGNRIVVGPVRTEQRESGF
jgi:membrane-bound ClpP family serine protease